MHTYVNLDEDVVTRESVLGVVTDRIRQCARTVTENEKQQCGGDDKEMEDADAADIAADDLDREVNADKDANAAEEDLALFAIQHAFKDNPAKLVKAVREHTLRSTRQASASKSRVDAGVLIVTLAAQRTLTCLLASLLSWEKLPGIGCLVLTCI
ncbi:hypothetical protein ABBQ32_003265 [Trebouxia sp. C0010 RCD-2024]